MTFTCCSGGLHSHRSRGIDTLLLMMLSILIQIEDSRLAAGPFRVLFCPQFPRRLVVVVAAIAAVSAVLLLMLLLLLLLLLLFCIFFVFVVVVVVSTCNKYIINKYT